MAKRNGALDLSILRLITVIGNCTRLVLAFIARISLQQETVILTYHSIASNGDSFSVTPDVFRRQMDYLRRNYSVLPLVGISSFAKRKGKIPKKSVSITFDDGYNDFYINAYPYFKKYKLPATVFVTTGHIGKESSLSEYGPKILTWNEIEEISNNNIEIGAHTVTHPNLQERNPSNVEYEITGSKREIENHLRRTVRFFSYPFGRYNNQILEIVENSGFEAAVGGQGSVHEGSYVFILNRVQIDRSVCFPQFRARLTKGVDWSKKIEQIVKKFLRKKVTNAAYI